jgi:hypothetical protein
MFGRITGLPCSWRKWIQEHDPQGWGVSKIETINYAHESRGTQIWKVQTCLLVREGAHINKPETVYKIIKERMGNVGRTITLTSSSSGDWLDPPPPSQAPQHQLTGWMRPSNHYVCWAFLVHYLKMLGLQSKLFKLWVARSFRPFRRLSRTCWKKSLVW